MTFLIEIETLKIEERLDNMIAKLARVPVPAELHAWQVQDMRRKYPYVEELNPTAARTLIYPRSRKRRVYARSNRPAFLRAKPKVVHRGKATRAAPGTRPILRPELFERLRERMNDMLQREVKW